MEILGALSQTLAAMTTKLLPFILTRHFVKLAAVRASL